MNTLYGDFVHDDIPAIVNNPDVNGKQVDVMELFSNDFWGEPMSSVTSHKSYRPLTILIFRYLLDDFWVLTMTVLVCVTLIFLQTELFFGPWWVLAFPRDQYDVTWLCHIFAWVHLQASSPIAKTNFSHRCSTVCSPSYSHWSCKIFKESSKMIWCETQV